MFNAEQDIKKWAPVLEHADAPAIKDAYRKSVTAKLLENTEKAIREEAAQGTYGQISEATNTTSAANFNPVLISLVRRAMPNLIAYDIAGVQPMSGPTGLIFAMKSRKNDLASSPSQTGVNTNDPEILFNEADTAFSGTASGSLSGVDGIGHEKTAGEATNRNWLR